MGDHGEHLQESRYGKGVPVKHITSHFRDTINPYNVMDDAIHNFSRVYQKYAQQGDLSEEELDSRAGGVVANSDEDSASRGAHPPRRGSLRSLKESLRFYNLMRTRYCESTQLCHQ